MIDMIKVLAASILFSLAISSCSSKKQIETASKNKQVTITNNEKDSTPVEVTDPKLTEVWEPEPKYVNAGPTNASPPSDAIVLFDGKSSDSWVHYDGSPAKWNVSNDVMTVKPGTGDIKTKEMFGDVQLHLEWRSPVEPNRKGQDKGNSGVFLQRKYEVQVLNSFNNRTYSNGQAGSIYKQYPPLVNATAETGDWNAYDIVFHAPKFEGKKMVKPGTLTVFHNGVLIQDNIELKGTTEYIGPPKVIAHGDDHIVLQDHSNEVSYRNIWLRKL